MAVLPGEVMPGLSLIKHLEEGRKGTRLTGTKAQMCQVMHGMRP